MRTYDIINAGPRDRFMANGRIVSNSSKIINLQNLPRNHGNLEDAREGLKRGEPTDPDTLSGLIRTALIPEDGKRFIVADFSSIEARVVAWLAGEEWVLRAFRDGQDIYCATAEKMYGVPVDKSSPLRQKGKTATLACSYGGSVGALKAIGGNSAFISDNDSELKAIVDAWRGANPHIVALWQKLEDAVFAAIRHPNRGYCAGRLTARCGGETLFITLPSGRALAYRHPRIEEGRWGRRALTYEGYDVAHKWGRVESFGGKLVENCLAHDTLVLTDKGLMPIAEITQDEKIWDGVEWVSHDGVINQGVQETIQVDGLRMTPEHKILTESGEPPQVSPLEGIRTTSDEPLPTFGDNNFDAKGWTACAKSAGFKWAKVRLPDGFGAERSPQNAKITLHPTRRAEQVYDIRNCGPRHQFVVYDGGDYHIVSNCTQATARDILMHAMENLRDYGAESLRGQIRLNESARRVTPREGNVSDNFGGIVAHVHDEIILETNASAHEIIEIMTRVPDWAKGLPLSATGFETMFYRKE